MRPVLAVTEPTALPTAMSALPSRAENTDTSISGMVVAKLTTVAPMMNFGDPGGGVYEQVAALDDAHKARREQQQDEKEGTAGKIEVHNAFSFVIAQKKRLSARS